MGPGKPGKSWNFILARSVWKAIRRINIEILGVLSLESLESLKSPGKVLKFVFGKWYEPCVHPLQW